MSGRTLLVAALVSTLAECGDRANALSTASAFKPTDISAVDCGYDSNHPQPVHPIHQPQGLPT